MSFQVLAIAAIPAVIVLLVAAVTHSGALTILAALLAASFAIFYGRPGYAAFDLLVLGAGCWVAWRGLSRLAPPTTSSPPVDASVRAAPKRQGRSLLGRTFVGAMGPAWDVGSLGLVSRSPLVRPNRRGRRTSGSGPR